MPSTRIFIGNLSLGIEESHIKKKFSVYGIINSIDIKNKLDIEGNSVSRFAYINLDAQSWDVNKCVQETNGSQLEGSFLKVEIAKENFLDRLRREREQANQQQDTSNKGRSDKISYDYNFEKPIQSTYVEREFKKLPYNLDNSNNFNKFDNSYNNFDSNYDNNEYNSEYPSQETYNEDGQTYKENRSYGFKDESGLKEFSTFKRYYPTTSENFKDNKVIDNSNIDANEAQKSFVNVYSKLSFKEESSSFSLLEKFASLPKEEHLDDRNEELEHSKKIARLEQIYSREDNERKKIVKKKTHNFFISSDDPLLEGAVEWILTPLTEENEKEFQSARSSLTELSKLRDSRAKRDNHLRGRKSKFARFKR